MYWCPAISRKIDLGIVLIFIFEIGIGRLKVKKSVQISIGKNRKRSTGIKYFLSFPNAYELFSAYGMVTLTFFDND